MVAIEGSLDNRTQYERMAKQLLLNMLYFCNGLLGMIRGPTLQDLNDLYGVDLATVSYTLIVGTIGGLVGSFGIGAFLHRLPRIHFTIIVSNFALLAFANAFLPHSGSLWLFLVFSGIVGFAFGAGHTGLNAICLEVWQGFNSGPYMHSLHMFFSVGAFLAPIVSKPFLSQKVVMNGTEISSDDSQIGILYPLTSVIAWIICLAGVYFILKEVTSQRKRSNNDPDKNSSETEDSKSFFGNTIAVPEKIVLLVLMMTFFAVYTCMEFGTISYLPAFATEAEVHLSRKEASDVLAVTMFTFMAARVVAIGAAIKLNPTHVVVINVTCCLIGNGLIVYKGYYDSTYLYIGSGLNGFGLGAMWANGILWVEKYIPVQGHVASLLSGAGGIGVVLAPVIIGNTIASTPMILPYLEMGILALTIVLFVAAALVGRRIKQKEKEQKEQNVDTRL